MESSMLNRLGSCIRRYFSRRDLLIFGIAFAAAMLVHFYGFTDKYINHDDVDGLYSDCGFALASGRWFLQAVQNFIGTFSSSWLNGLVGSFSLAASVTLIAQLFRLRRIVTVLLLSVSLAAFPTVVATYSYMFSAGAYLFAMLLAVAGVWMMRRETWTGWVAGVILLALSMGCYQAYFCLAALLAVMLLIYDLCIDRWGGGFKPAMMTALKYLSVLAVAILLYYGTLKLLLAVTGTVLTEYQGISSMGEISVSILLQRIETAFQNYGSFLNNRLFAVFGSYFSILVKAAVAVGLGTVVFCVVRKKLWRQWSSMILLVLLLAVYPLASCLIYLMTDVDVHLLMVYPLALTLVLPCFAIEHLRLPDRTWACRGVAVLGAGLILLQSLIAYEQVRITNRAYFAMDITYENVYAYYLKLSTKIELTEGWTKDTPVAFLGTATMDNYVPDTGITGVLVGDAALNIYSYDRIFSYYMGTSYSYVAAEKKTELSANEIVRAMPCYPNSGSIAMVDGIMVVKLSE